jgi:hypothetical protein
MDGCGMDVSCVSASVIASMYGVHILGLICMWDAYSTLMCTVSWSYMHPHTPSYYKKKSKNSGLPGVVSMNVPCIGALVCASTHGLDMVTILCVWCEVSAWICTVYWSYMHSHVPCVMWAGVHRIQDRVLMDGCSMDAPCISVLVFASMYGVHILGLICMWDAYSTLMCTVSWSYKRHHASCS